MVSIFYTWRYAWLQSYDCRTVRVSFKEVTILIRLHSSTLIAELSKWNVLIGHMSAESSAKILTGKTLDLKNKISIPCF